MKFSDKKTVVNPTNFTAREGKEKVNYDYKNCWRKFWSF